MDRLGNRWGCSVLGKRSIAGGGSLTEASRYVDALHYAADLGIRDASMADNLAYGGWPPPR